MAGPGLLEPAALATAARARAQQALSAPCEKEAPQEAGLHAF
jgi:hypothetical protein